MYRIVGSSKWSTCATIGPSARYYHQTCSANGRVILFGGLGIKERSDKAVNLNDMWVYTGASKSRARFSFVKLTITFHR
jgi:N-acetylneuraminic acid mutarotase